MQQTGFTTVKESVIEKVRDFPKPLVKFNKRVFLPIVRSYDYKAITWPAGREITTINIIKKRKQTC